MMMKSRDDDDDDDDDDVDDDDDDDDYVVFIPKSTPATVGPQLSSTFPPQKSETPSYSTLLKKSEKLSLSIFF